MYTYIYTYIYSIKIYFSYCRPIIFVLHAFVIEQLCLQTAFEYVKHLQALQSFCD